MVATAAQTETNRRLPGEDLAQDDAEIAGWTFVYEELASILQATITRSTSEEQADELRRQLGWIEIRLAEWRERHAQVSGIVLDARRTLRRGRQTIRLTRREAELLEFLLRHPRRRFTPKELATLAWRSPWLSDSQVRTYMMRLRRRMRDVGFERLPGLMRSRGYGIGRRRLHGATRETAA